MEDPKDWIGRIQRALADSGGMTSFEELRTATALSPGALFLGLLLGQELWTLRQEHFYGEVQVSDSMSNAKVEREFRGR